MFSKPFSTKNKFNIFTNLGRFPFPLSLLRTFCGYESSVLLIISLCYHVNFTDQDDDGVTDILRPEGRYFKPLVYSSRVEKMI